MRTCDYTTDVLPQVLALANTDTTNATAADKAKVAAFVQRRGRQAWQFHWWPETMNCEERFYRALYASGTTYAAPTATVASEVYFPPTRSYYQALVSTTGNAPAALTGGVYVTDLAHWAVVGEAMGADWLTLAAYAVGAVVRNPDTGRYNQCHTAHTAGATFDTTKFGILTPWVPYIGLDQAGKTAIGLVRGCYLGNPLVLPTARRVHSQLGPLGIHVPGNGWASLFVLFQSVAPADFTASSVIPALLRDAIAHAAFSDFLRPAAQTDDVPLEETAGYAFLTDEVRKFTAMQRQAGKWTQN